MVIHPAEVVFARIVGQMCERREDLDTEASLRFTHNGKLISIPRPLEDDGYTQAQLEEIERALAAYGLDLLPLDPNTYLN